MGIEIGQRIKDLQNDTTTEEQAKPKDEDCPACDKPSKELVWDSYRQKHRPPPRIPWDKIVESTANRGYARYHPDVGGSLTAQETFERAAWDIGKPSTREKNYRYAKFPRVIGASDGKETIYVRIECTSPGVIHGHPVTAEEYRRHIGSL